MDTDFHSTAAGGGYVDNPRHVRGQVEDRMNTAGEEEGRELGREQEEEEEEEEETFQLLVSGHG